MLPWTSVLRPILRGPVAPDLSGVTSQTSNYTEHNFAEKQICTVSPPLNRSGVPHASFKGVEQGVGGRLRNLKENNGKIKGEGNIGIALKG